MANNASVIWTGDTTFDLNLAAESTTQSCFITTLYETWQGPNGPIEASANLSNASASYTVGILVTQFASGVWGSVLNCTGRGAPAYIEDVYILFGTQSEASRRAYNIFQQFNSSHSVSAVNSYIQSLSWTQILTRRQATPLTTPSGLYADNITSDSARTNWQAVENASNYKVQYKAAGDTVWTETYTD